MLSKLKRPSAPMAVSIAALVVALGGTSYAATQIQTKDIAKNAVTSSKIKDGTIKNADLGPRVRGLDGKDGVNGLDGKDGQNGIDGRDGAAGPAGVGRWLLIDKLGAIVAQSGGFEVEAAYDIVNNTGATVPGGALGNVYIEANEPLSNNGITVSIALQNQADQNGDAIMNGRAPGADSNPEFSGEISATMCAITGIVGCAPVGTNFRDYFVVSPRMSDGSVTVSGTDTPGGAGTGPNTHKRFYVIITGDSSDFVAPTPPVPPVAIP